MQIRGSWEDIPEGTLVYAGTFHDDAASPYVEGPIEYRVGGHGTLEPFIGDKPLTPDSIIVLTPGLVDRELNVSFGGYGPAWGVGLAGDEIRYDNHGWGNSEDLIVPLTAEAWEGFVRSCDELRIWRWKRRYEPRPEKFADDLPGWDVVVEAHGRRVVSGGYGVFPKTFWKFVNALGELLGGAAIE